MEKKQLPVELLRRELQWGTRYLLFQLVFLGSVLALLLSFLGLPSGDIYLDTAYFTVNFGIVNWIFHSYLRNSFKHGIRHWRKLLVTAALGFTVYFLLTQGLDALIHWLKPEFYNVNDAGITEYTRSHFWVTAVGAVVLVPLAEETLYRGLIFGGLHPKNRLLAYGISTLFFAFVHVMGYIGSYSPSLLILCFLQYIPAGLALAGAYEYSGSILAPVLIHTAVNTIAILSMR